MRKNIFIMAALLCFQYKAVLCQHDFRPGFIVRNEGDSISGFVDFRGNKKNEKICLFRETKKGQSKSYKPNQIKAYGFSDGKRFETFALNDSQFVFAEKIISGKASLFRYKRIFYITNGATLELPKKQQSNVITDKGTHNKTVYPYIGVLNTLLSECGLNANEVRYEEREMTQVVQKYNTCLGSKGIVHKQNKPWTQSYVTLFSGIDISTLTVDGLSSSTFGKSYSPITGIGIDVSSPRVNEKIFLTVEVSYLKKFYQGYTEDQVNANVLDRMDHLIDISFIKLPIGIRYNFLSDKQTPFIHFGLAQYFKLDSSLEVLTERENRATDVVSTYSTFLDEERSQMGFWIGAGYNKSLAGKLKAFIELRYEWANGFYGGLVHPNPSSKTQNINILAGIRF